MKHILYILTILLIIKACEQENKTPKPTELPKTVTIYYTANLVPWTETRFIPITPDLFLSTKEKQSVIRLTAPTSLCSFHNMMSSGKPISVQWKFDTWFSAILDYRTYSDTISVYGYYIQCNDAIKVDSNAIFYFIHEINMEPLITEELKLEDFETAIEHARKRPTGFCKAVFTL